jgi:hypothetical protein
MGNVPVKPSRRNLPKPREGTHLDSLLNDAGFVWGDALNEGHTHRVTMPDGWLLQNTSDGVYGDYVNLRLIDPQGKVVAHINGKFTSYDSHCDIYQSRLNALSLAITRCEDWLPSPRGLITSKQRICIFISTTFFFGPVCCVMLNERKRH